MFPLDFLAKYPALVLIFLAVMILANLTFLWIFGRIGDNVNKIRRMLEEEIRRRHES